MTIPNAICVGRAICSPLMLVLAWNGLQTATLVLFLILTFSDFVDGKLARWLNQRSAIGPKLDSFSDAVMYGCLALALIFLRGDLLGQEVLWIVFAIVSYIAAGMFALAKFGQLPSYHTRSAKLAWLMVAIAAVALLSGGPAWPLRMAMATVMIANLESSCITYLLKRPLTDLASVFRLHAVTDSADTSREDEDACGVEQKRFTTPG
ncbi:CDP-alcohol phosphatidyltransferase family protein [Stieleria magnilauensis]|uniref:CDP-alcohol phosphatidyltransferase family protein n=1 Tax=Stieleria magnilauensis TaxID=2527963 RepID=UPI003AF77EBF